jgi:hypothetical protein
VPRIHLYLLFYYHIRVVFPASVCRSVCRVVPICTASSKALVAVSPVPFHVVQGDSLAKGPKRLSIKNYVIEIMT